MEALHFSGKGSEYFKIWIVNVLLTIITIGIYYPWAKVRNRRYFYANTNLANRNFEYHATGKQLLLGFLIGVFLFSVYTFVTQIAPQFAGIFMLLFMLILPWLIWRSLMFNMRVTSFSNVHFSFKGSLGRSYAIFLGYPLVGFLLLMVVGGLASTLIPALNGSGDVPTNKTALAIGSIIFGLLIIFGYIFMIALIRAKSKEYIIGNSYYGQGAFSTKLETKEFIKIYAKAFGLILIPLIIMAIGMSSLHYGGGAEIVFIVGYFGTLLGMLVIMAYVVSRERAYIYKNTLLDNKVAFKSTLGAREFAFVMFTNFLLVVFTIGLATPWAKVRVARLMLANTLVDTSVGFDEYITQQQSSVSAIGEQIGEAFDIDIDVGF